MKRPQLLLSVVAAILVVALFWYFLYQPKREALAEVEADITAEEAIQVQLQAEINRLRAVRDEAPEVEAELAAAEVIIPRDAALPSALRQLQLAADEAGLVLTSLTTDRPEAVEGGPHGLASIGLDVQLLGGYFQVVDFLRRVEDPMITPRGLVWGDVTLVKDEYPALIVTLSGSLFVVLPEPPPAVEETAPDAEAAEDDEPADDAEAAEQDALVDEAGDVLQDDVGQPEDITTEDEQ